MNNKRLKKACESRELCDVCRNDERQRQQIGFPDICPYGYTKDNLPTKEEIEKANKQPVMKKPAPNPDKCKFAVRDCCGKPHICSVTMGDCHDYFDKNCSLRIQNKG